MEDKDKIRELENKVEQLYTMPYRCEVCGKPTDGWTKVLFGRHHFYCKDHYPMSFMGAATLNYMHT
jgi:hypothetical protein